ncbi:MAG: hypothetical protein EBS23_09900, partial [Betaproteobacteria bacterium]|nr:hypothetical protein [Betaproteobacteria bacterium]
GALVDIAGARINAGAPRGIGGLWLIDPYDYTINSAAAGIISGSLNNGTSVTVTTSVQDTTLGASAADTVPGGSGSGDITVTADIAKSAGAAATLTLTAANKIDITANIGNTGANLLSLVLDTGGASSTAASGTVSGTLSGNLALTKQGAGRTTLSGVNTYSGGTTLQGGNLNLGSANAIGTTGTITFAGGTLVYSLSNQTDYSARFSTAASQAYRIDTNEQDITLANALISSGGSFTKFGSGTLTLTGNNSYSGGTTISAGRVVVGHDNALGSGSVTFADGTKLRAVTDPTKVIGNNITLNGRTTVEVPFGGATDIELAGVISGSGSLGVASDVSGRGLTLSGNNTFTGGVEIFADSGSSPNLRVEHSNALGTGTLTVTGTPQTGSDQLIASANNLNLANAVSLGSGSSFGINTGGNVLTLSGVMSGTGALRKNGTGPLTLSGANTYTGSTAISAGTLVIENDQPLASGQFSGAGSLVIQSASNSFSSAFSTSGLSFGSDLGSLTIGKTTNTANVTLGSIGIAGPITARGGTVTVGDALSITGSAGISLTGSTAIDLLSAGSITAGTGNVTLASPLVYVRSGSGSVIQTGGNVSVSTSVTGNLNNDHLKFANRAVDATDIDILNTQGNNFLLGLKFDDTAGLFIADIRNLNANGTLTLGSTVDNGSQICGFHCRLTAVS